MSIPDLPLLDWISFGVIGIASLRGLLIGLIREGISLATVAVATIVTRLYVDPLASALATKTEGELTGRTGIWIAGLILVVGTAVVLSLVGRFVRRGAEAAGLGWADRLGGGALGAAEGTVVASILVVIALWLFGPNHAVTRDARSVAAVEQIRAWRDGGEPPSVASPGRWR